MLRVGDIAPDFVLRDQDEEEAKLSDFLGNWIVLYFYPKDNTPGCTIEALDFTLNKEEFERMNAEIIGVSSDSCESHRKFIKSKQLNLKLLSDPNHQVIEQYGAWKKKKMFGSEYYGIARSTYLIDPQGKINSVWTNVHAKGHADEVKTKLSLVI